MSFGARPGELPERASDAGPEFPFAYGWREREHEGGGDLVALSDDRDLIPLEGYDDPHERRKHDDEMFELGKRCGIEISRDERRQQRFEADERRARRALIFQTLLLTTICVVIVCVTAIITHG